MKTVDYRLTDEVDSTYARELISPGKPVLRPISTPELNKKDIVENNLLIYHVKITESFTKDDNSPIGVSLDTMRNLCKTNNVKITGKKTPEDFMNAYKEDFIERIKKHLPSSGIPTQTLCAYTITGNTPFFMNSVPITEIDFKSKPQFSLLEWGIIISSLLKSTPTTPDVLYSWYINLFNSWIYDKNNVSPFLNSNEFNMNLYLYGTKTDTPVINSINGSWDIT